MSEIDASQPARAPTGCSACRGLADACGLLMYVAGIFFSEPSVRPSDALEVIVSCLALATPVFVASLLVQGFAGRSNGPSNVRSFLGFLRVTAWIAVFVALFVVCCERSGYAGAALILSAIITGVGLLVSQLNDGDAVLSNVP